MRLQGKVALVTGGASGFGAETARRFVREGAAVVILDLNGEGAMQVAKEIGNAKGLKGDATIRANIDEAVQLATKTFGRLDIVVNNAGWTHRNKPLLEVTEQEFDRIFAINVKSIFHMVQAVVPVISRQGGGAIINIGSTAGIRPRPGLTWYNASKGAVNLCSKSLAVKVNCVAPVMGETALLESFMGMPDTPENRAKFVGTIPLGRLARPADVAGACVYLASDDAEFLTGVILTVDGGRTI
jgi:3-oxoacyl-[acyl-carrier protein] reductase